MATDNTYHPCWLWDVYCNILKENKFWKLDRVITRPYCILLCASPHPSCWKNVYDRELVGRLTMAGDIDWRRWMTSFLIPHAKRLTAIYISISHYSDVIMRVMASQIISLTVVYWTVYSGADQRKHQSCASLAFVRGIHRWAVNSPHEGPVTRKMFVFDDVIMSDLRSWCFPYGYAGIHSKRTVASNDILWTHLNKQLNKQSIYWWFDTP